MEKRKESVIDLNLTQGKGLISISNELKTKFLLYEIKKLCKKFKLEFNHIDRSIVVYIDSKKIGLKFEEVLNKQISQDLGNFLEKETEKDRKVFDRTITLYESSIDFNKFNMYW